MGCDNIFQRLQLHTAPPRAFIKKAPGGCFIISPAPRRRSCFSLAGGVSDRRLLTLGLHNWYHYITNYAIKKLDELAKNIEVEISPFFSSEELNQLAKEARFVQRQSKLDGYLFLALIVFNNENLKEESLNDLSADLMIRHGIEIRKQSLHERFNKYAVLFLKNAMELILRNQLEDDVPLGNFEGINRVLVKDSVCFQIDNSLAEHYPGSGGENPIRI